MHGRRGEPIVMPDGRVGHVEVLLGDSVLMLADEFPEMGLLAPAHLAGVSQSLRLEVADPDAVVAAAVAAGGTLDRPVADSPYGRGGVVLDPSGHRWMVSREAPAARPGDVVYSALWRPDVQRADRFYRAVLGWTTAAAHTAAGPARHRVDHRAGAVGRRGPADHHALLHRAGRRRGGRAGPGGRRHRHRRHGQPVRTASPTASTTRASRSRSTPAAPHRTPTSRAA